MKMKNLRPWLMALALGLAVNTYADSADLLRRAYGELASANHDYKGHRVSAMKEVREAARVLGVDLSGDEGDRLNQRVSDLHLRNAQGILKAAASGLSGESLQHVVAAERQISIALSIK
jgi:hypothetical protein